MTNCPNCGAPYKLGIPVCEYCGTPREEANDDNIRDTGSSQNRIAVNAENGAIVFIGAVNGVKDIQATYKTVTPDPSQQAACGAQALANAASHNTCSFEQMRLNAEQARVSDVELRQTVALQQRMQAVRSDIMRQKHSEEQFYSHLLCFVILTFLSPLAIPICLILSIKTAIVAKLLGMFLIPTRFCLGYIISLCGMKRYKGGRR